MNVKLLIVFRWTIVILGIMVAGIIVASWYKPDIFPRMQVLSVDEVASAMRNGEYFAKYGTDWVLVSGVIDYIDYSSNEQVLTFKTSGVSHVRCRVHDVNLRFRKDVLVQLRASGAHRDGQNVIFDDCRPLK